jgi:hypothetical protein
MFVRPESTKFPIVQAIRGIASLGVCWVHLTLSFPESSWIAPRRPLLLTLAVRDLRRIDNPHLHYESEVRADCAT